MPRKTRNNELPIMGKMGQIKRRTRRKTTINDLFTTEGVSTVFEHIAEHRSEMSSLMAIYEDKEGNINWKCDPNITLSKVVFLLEQVKYCQFSGEDE